eukprot:TRINITY_DN8206_c0_g2_i1.p3 TRINITY_DN8206_c0_g2~~TRINITY_DN8206_c0_g2_i1.p3  ORF type:complete len:193 (-),score=6.84 TRINITY_DN8206_c0_g2_i1:1126-1704(-)
MGSLWSTLRWNMRSDEEIEERARTAFEHYRCGYSETGSPAFDCVASALAEKSIFDTLTYDDIAVVDPKGCSMHVGNISAAIYFYKYTAKYNKMVLAAARTGVPFVCPVCERERKKKQQQKIKEQTTQNPSDHELESKSLATVDNSLSEENGDKSSSQPLLVKRQVKQIWFHFLIFSFVLEYSSEKYKYKQSN